MNHPQQVQREMPDDASVETSEQMQYLQTQFKDQVADQVQHFYDQMKDQIDSMFEEMNTCLTDSVLR